MKQEKLEDILGKIEKLHNQSQYSQLIKLIEGIDPADRAYILQKKLAKAYCNLGVLGDNNAYGDEGYTDNEKIQIGICLLAEIADQGKEDYEWYRHMANAYLMVDGFPNALDTAIEYAKKWGELNPAEQEEARAFIEDCLGYKNEDDVDEDDMGDLVDFDLLDQVCWDFYPEQKNDKELFKQELIEELIEYANDLDQELNLAQLDKIAIDLPEILIVYEAWISSRDDLYENERLDEEDELLEEDKEDGMWQVEIFALLKADNGKNFTLADLIMKIHNQQANKDLGDHTFFEGLEYSGYETHAGGLVENDEGLPVFFVVCGS